MPEQMSVEDKLDTLRVYCHVLEGFAVALASLELDRLGAEKLSPAARKSAIAFLQEALHKLVEAEVADMDAEAAGNGSR